MRPERANTVTRMRFTGIPEYSAASRFAPIAYV